MSAAFATVRTVGGVLPPDLLSRVIAGDPGLGGWSSGDFHLAGGETSREAANRAWSYLVGVWETFRAARTRLPEGDPAVGVTRERWLLLLLRELGYGRVATTPTGGLHVGDRSFPVSHLWGRMPIHLLGWGVSLDRRTKGVSGASERAPHAMLQELLNRSDDHMWGVVSNGRVLRLLRDSTNLSGQSFVEFDLEAMFDGEVFSDFALLYFLLHESRVEVLSKDGPASDCWLERWRTASIESGTRALSSLREGVRQAIEALGTGFLQAPGGDLHRQLADRELRTEDFHHALLRLVYRLLFLFVAEDRGALLDPKAEAPTRQRYEQFFSTARLRRLSLRRHGSLHTDLWGALSLVIDALGRPGGLSELGLPGLGGLFESGPLDVVTGQPLTNDKLIAAIRHLHVVQPKGQPKRTVDYRNLGAEELGGIYESLLELMPRFDSVERTLTLETLPGNQRKTSGSYYTPTALIDLVLDEALDPLLDDAEKSSDPEAALLGLTVCDPACGSGPFLVAAARRIADRLAVVRTGDVDPTPESQQVAMYDVVARCIYGVELNPMTAELTKFSLWLEALQPGRPLNFLDAHIKVGNALLGTTPALLARGIPDGAFDAIEGDDKRYAAALKKINRQQRDNVDQGELFDATTTVSNRALRELLERALPEPPRSLEDLQVTERRYRDYEASLEFQAAKQRADTWCAAFVQPKLPGSSAITTNALDHLGAEATNLVEKLTNEYRFFHWHLEFPNIFEVLESASTPAGWHGGFSAMVGNPPWETVQMSEKEFFASRAPEIANAPTTAKRKQLIAALEESDPQLYSEFLAESRRREGLNLLVRGSGRYPLCARGKINTYSIFAEHFRSVIELSGRMGIITPTGIATDATTAAYFSDTLRSGRLAAFYDFENEGKIFTGVHHAFRFAVTAITGGERVSRAHLAFVIRHIDDVPARRFALTAEEALLLNPNTGTLPTFRSRSDAEITLGIYRRHPVLIREGDSGGNPWELSFSQGLFNMASDSGLFETADDLEDTGAEFDGWAWSKDDERWLPLYEAKLLTHYDHRLSTYESATQAQLNVGSLPRVTDAAHDDPAVEPLVRYWVAEKDIDDAVGNRWDRDWLLGWRDIARSTDIRTFVPSVLPRSAVGNKFPLAFPSEAEWVPLLQATWSSLACDYVSRQKLSGTGMTYFIVKQIACPPPEAFDEAPSWNGRTALSGWIRPRVLELSYTSWRLQPYARDMGDGGPPFRWLPERREVLRAELDAAMFHVYGLGRTEVEHVLDSFPVLRKYEERDHGEFRAKRLVLEVFDAMQRAAETGTPYQTRLDPQPGEGPRHPSRVRSHEA